MVGTEIGSDVAADIGDLGIESGVNVVGKVMIMLAGALTMAKGGESGVASEPGAGPGIGEELLVECGVDSIAVVLSIPGPSHYLIPTSLGQWSWVQHAPNKRLV